MTEPKLNTTREERDEWLSALDDPDTDIDVFDFVHSGIVGSVLQDANTLEDEIARVREDAVAMEANMTEARRRLRAALEELEAARLVVDAAHNTVAKGLNTYGQCLGLPEAVSDFDKRFGGRDDV